MEIKEKYNLRSHQSLLRQVDRLPYRPSNMTAYVTVKSCGGMGCGPANAFFYKGKKSFFGRNWNINVFLEREISDIRLIRCASGSVEEAKKIALALEERYGNRSITVEVVN